MKNFRLHQGDNRCQQGNTPTTDINATTVKKNKKIEKNLSQVKYFSYHKKGHYTNKCFN